MFLAHKCLLVVGGYSKILKFKIIKQIGEQG